MNAKQQLLNCLVTIFYNSFKFIRTQIIKRDNREKTKKKDFYGFLKKNGKYVYVYSPTKKDILNCI